MLKCGYSGYLRGCIPSPNGISSCFFGELAGIIVKKEKKVSKSGKDRSITPNPYFTDGYQSRADVAELILW